MKKQTLTIYKKEMDDSENFPGLFCRVFNAIDNGAKLMSFSHTRVTISDTPENLERIYAPGLMTN